MRATATITMPVSASTRGAASTSIRPAIGSGARTGRARPARALATPDPLWSILDLPPAPEQRVAGSPEQDVQHQQPERSDQDRRIAEAQEAVAKARDHIEEGVGVADFLEGRGQRLDRIESAA